LLTAEFIVYCVLNFSCQAELGEIQRYQDANPVFSINNSTCSAIQLSVDTYLKDIWDAVAILSAAIPNTALEFHGNIFYVAKICTTSEKITGVNL